MACTVPGFAVISQPLPRYPDILRQAGLGGVVHMRILVDTGGRVAINTYKVLSSSHDLFAIAVRNAAAAWRFARPGGADRPAHVVYEAAFRFALVPKAGVLKSEGSPPPETDAPVGVEVTDSTEHRRLAWELVKALVARDTEKTGKPTFCTSASTYETIFIKGRWLVPMKLCPKTFTSMIAPHRPEDVAPRGWVDPIAYGVQRIVRYGEVLTFRAGRAWGTTKNVLECTAVLLRDAVADLDCRVERTLIS